jgi:hypothetical protein
MKDGLPYTGSTDSSSASYGSIMRLAPVPMFFATTPAEAIAWDDPKIADFRGRVTCLIDTQLSQAALIY